MPHTIGIDLRTAGACAAVWVNGRGYIIPDTGREVLAGYKTYTRKLAYCKSAAEAWLNQRVDGAVVAIPAGFNMGQRQAILDAGKAAGLEIRRLMPETTAAALHYSRRQMQEGKHPCFLACSLSGNALSLSVVETRRGVIEILDCAGLDFFPEAGWTRDAELTARKLLESAGREPSFALVAGDAARNTQIENALRRLVGETFYTAKASYIAVGAALQGAIASGHERDLPVLDVLTPAARLRTAAGVELPLHSPRHPEMGAAWTLPGEVVKTIRRDSECKICLLQGGQTVKRLRWEDLVPAGWKGDEAEICFSVDLNGLVEASFRETDNKAKPPEEPAQPAGAEDVIQALLPVYDNLERAMRQDTRDSAYKKGVELTMRQFKSVFAGLGVVEIDALGKPFDPRFHDAVMHIEDGSFGQNIVSQVFQAGFTRGGKVIRFAAVQVAN